MHDLILAANMLLARMEDSELLDPSSTFDGIRNIISHKFDDGVVLYLVELVDESSENIWIKHEEISNSSAVKNYWKSLDDNLAISEKFVDNIEIMGRIQGNQTMYYAVDIQPDFGVHLFDKSQVMKYDKQVFLDFLCNEFKNR